MTHDLSFVGALCSPGGLGLSALLLAGLLGSVAHCVPMCGPFVLAQVSANLARIPAARLCERQRLSQGVLLPYHLGRLTTYAVLGGGAAGASSTLGALPWLDRLPALLLLLGALLFLGQAIHALVPRFSPGTPGLVPWSGAIAALVRRIDRSRPTGGLLLGLLLGFLPCGFLYAALAVAASAATPARGALAMVAFGFGTWPGLAVVGIAGQVGGRLWNRLIVTVGPVLLLFNALLLTVLAFQRMVQ